MKGYHWRDGVWFNRLPDGSVTVRVEVSADKYFDVGAIPAAEWESIVRAMAPASGEPSGAEAVVREEDGVALIAAERRRQVTEKGWTAAHDDAHRYGELGKVAAVLAVHCTDARVEDPDGWDSASDPWRIIEKTQAKTKNAGEAHRRLLTIAGALIAAEIDRLQRLPTAPGAPEEGAGES